ncbi:putative succinate-semialdehyde dehydrogenase Uga2 [Ascodesmis nigricans]|uniref:Succinate-semialdehyde dehydrogenase n=1 Tax=Ascodesmis nigricans TaxID=341454 RepID=A0A4S2N1M7_9PEZI|nr:putative succinate-semialdehyde dehydrogenase Uga2 [Ascodesmis nigricans]
MPALAALLRPLNQQSRSILPHLAKRIRPTIILPPSRTARLSLSTHNVPKLADPSLLQPYPFVNNEFLTLDSLSANSTFDVHDPATGALIATIPDQNVQDTRTAIDAAAAAFTSFRRTTARERSRLLKKWYDLVMENKEDLATIITWENGKPLADARTEVVYAASFLEWFAEEAPRVYGDVIPVNNPVNRVVTQKMPVGVCGLITPWNFPAAMITRKIAPAIAAGCTAVCKSPGETPLTALALAELSRRAGFPDGVINILTTLANTPSVGKELCTHPTIRKISFTGSTHVGKILMSQASSTLKKCSFELGGNAPFIVFADAPDLDAAVAGAVAAKFRSSGQTCVCANRIYVQDAIYDEFANRFTEKVKEFSLGHGFGSDTTHGPLIHDRAVDKAHSHVQDAVSQGATVTLGGAHREDLGPNFYDLTVLTGMTKEMAIHREETFGPVAALFKFSTEKEVVELANQSEVGLAGYFFSSNMGRIWRVAEALEVGMVGINTGMISDPAAPFGGVKQSGFGREGSKYGIDEFVQVKTMTFGGVGGELEG